VFSFTTNLTSSSAVIAQTDSHYSLQKSWLLRPEWTVCLGKERKARNLQS